MIDSRVEVEVPGFAGDRTLAQATGTDPEQLRRFTQDARELWDRYLQALKTVREEREGLRHASETAPVASEQGRVAAEIARTAGEATRTASDSVRQAALHEVRATANALSATLEQVKMIEDMRRALREIPDASRVDPAGR